MVKFYKQLKTDGFTFDHVSASTSASSVCHFQCLNLIYLHLQVFIDVIKPYQESQCSILKPAWGFLAFSGGIEMKHWLEKG